ncbi:MAG TPA: hypothetical protein VL096_08640 [Pirellulaceae bacterium]|nr:hypothetical protein [Pirellulaceae bacterium]
MMRVFTSVLATLTLVAFTSLPLVSVQAQDANPKTEVKVKAPAKAKGRLPAYYKDVVTPDQKDKIYAIQAKYGDEISKLAEQMKAATAQRDAEIAAILTAEQKDKVLKLRAAAGAAKDVATETTASEAAAAPK